jgi:hypothetical protein
LTLLSPVPPAVEPYLGDGIPSLAAAPI